MHKIVLFVPYFGPFPAHMALWVKSCAANPTIDWVLLTDQPLDISLPGNIRYICTDISSIGQWFADVLGITPNLTRPYKLCDLRPAYGLVFADLARGYDFWGYCDLDLIFGDFRAFITEDILDKYDKIQSRGHLSLYRNTDRVNTAFMERCPGVPNYRDVFADSRHYCFDERHGIYEIFLQKGVAQIDERVMAAIRPFKGHFQDSISGWDRVVFYWEAGKVFMVRLDKSGVESREVLYVHFRKRAMEGPAFDPDRARAFYLVPNAFIKKEPGVLNRRDIEAHIRGVPFYGITSRFRRLRSRGLKGYLERRAVSRIWSKRVKNGGQNK
jgi:hypothetical protein